MNYQKCFPFIIRDGKCQWMCPYEEVSIADFLGSNNLQATDPIRVDIDNVGGDGGFDLSDILSWIMLAWPYFKTYLPVGITAISVVDYASRVYKHFSNRRKKNKVPITGDIKDALYRRDNWTVEDAKKYLNCEDENLIELIMFGSGFVKCSEGYKKDKKSVEKYWYSDEKYGMECWGTYGYDNRYNQLRSSAQSMNMTLTDILCRSSNMGTGHFDRAMELVNQVIDKWEPLLQHGKDLKFISVNLRTRLFADETIDRI